MRMSIRSSQPLSLKPTVSTTSVSPSYLPIECPIHEFEITVGMSSPIQVDSAHQVILIEQEEHVVRELAELENTPIIQH